VGALQTVIAPPTDAAGGLFSEINDNSVAILLTYGTARILLAGDAEANEEEYMANGPYTGPLTIVRVPELHTLRGNVPRPTGRRDV
jgi:competence protein ComEC